MTCSSPDEDLVGRGGQGLPDDPVRPQRRAGDRANASIGIGRAAIRRAVAYANDRVVFGRPIGQNQAIAHPLAEALMRIDAADEMCKKAAWMIDHDIPCAREANMRKYLPADAAFRAADTALQTHGGFGFGKEFHVERYFRESRLQRLAPISQEMVLNYLSEHVLGLPRSY